MFASSAIILGLAALSAALSSAQSIGAGVGAGVTIDSHDICVFANVNLAAQLNGLLGLSLPDAKAAADLCLCVGDIPGFIQANADASAAVKQKGLPLVNAILGLLINESPSKQMCQYPKHSQKACIAGKPCGYTCTDGYKLVNNNCVCPAGSVVNSKGQCVTSSPSQRAKRDLASQLTMGHSKKLCPANKSVCGGFRGPSSYECIDTRTTLESCGGCVFAVPGLKPSGQDCSAIVGVADVACEASRCVVRACADNFSVSADGKSCVPN